MILGAAVAVLATAAAWLLTAPRPTPADRLAALCAPPRPPVPAARAPRQAGTPLRVLAACAPACTLAFTLGVPAAVLIGLPAGGALWWRLGRTDIGGARQRAAGIVAALPLTVELLAAALRAGSTMPAALDAVTGAVRGPLGAELVAVAERLRLGADPAAAWRSLDHPEELAALGRALARASTTGAPVADVLQRHADDLRSQARSRTVATAQRTGGLAVLPLGLCFLPAFVLIGVVPMAAELLTGASP
nr:type II secretion system F family protein [Murinocardiopsis flavida]